MFNKALLMSFVKKGSDDIIEEDDDGMTLVIEAKSDGKNRNIFTGFDDGSHNPIFYKVYINGVETDQVYYALNVVKGDRIKLVSLSSRGFPSLSFALRSYAKLLSTVLPYMTQASGKPLVSAASMFSYNTDLASISSAFFKHNTSVTNFESTFIGCSNLVTVGSGLFDNNLDATNFSGTFSSCSSLSSIPENLFEKQSKVTDFSGCFRNCKSLSGKIKIGSTSVTNASDFCSGAGAITVVVPAGSTTETTFRSLGLSNLTVETF